MNIAIDVIDTADGVGHVRAVNKNPDFFRGRGKLKFCEGII